WSDDLTGTTRLRVITNYLTRMRFCTSTGVLDLESKDSSPRPGVPNLGDQNVAAWFSHQERKTADERILFGHWATLGGQTGNPNAIALDTGCVWNGSLSLYHLDSGQLTRCACRDGKCRDTPVTTRP
ncbi:MAG TPA: diadenosine tetraphosphatase, partial [Halioglobus sp.]